MGWLSLRNALIERAMREYHNERAKFLPIRLKPEPQPTLTERQSKQVLSRIVTVEVNNLPGLEPWDPRASLEKYTETLLIRRPR